MNDLAGGDVYGEQFIRVFARYIEDFAVVGGDDNIGAEEFGGGRQSLRGREKEKQKQDSG
jgi:butyrate kinase